MSSLVQRWTLFNSLQCMKRPGNEVSGLFSNCLLNFYNIALSPGILCKSDSFLHNLRQLNPGLLLPVCRKPLYVAGFFCRVGQDFRHLKSMFANFRAIKNNGAHPDKRIFTNDATMQGNLMPNCHIIFQNQRITGTLMKHA